MLILLVVLTGLMAGVYFTFSVFVMKALDELPSLHAAQAMNKINDVIVNTLFLPIFFGSTIWYAGVIVWSITDWQNSQSILMILAASIYIVGMFLVTAFGNVPLNNRLKTLEENSDELVEYWSRYFHDWMLFNHLRTVSCIAACGILTSALM